MTNRHGVSLVAVGFAVAIAAVTVVAYQGVLSSEFIRYDDPRYVTENVHVREGLTAEGARWALTAVRALCQRITTSNRQRIYRSR